MKSILLIFADDSTLVLPCPVDKVTQALSDINDDILKIVNWLDENELKLNGENTELMFVASPVNLKRISQQQLFISVHHILPKDCVRILGLFLDSIM